MRILDAVSFADKIIFGKLNYNVKTTQFKDNEKFYEICSDTVVQFCKDRKIDYHIKYGTKAKDDKTTEHILMGPSAPLVLA